MIIAQHTSIYVESTTIALFAKYGLSSREAPLTSLRCQYHRTFSSYSKWLSKPDPRCTYDGMLTTIGLRRDEHSLANCTQIQHNTNEGVVIWQYLHHDW